MTNKPQTAEVYPGPGYRIRNNITRLKRDIIESFRPFGTPVISDLMNRLYAMCSAIHNVTMLQHSLIGPACTVKVYPGDNLMVHKALDIVQPGDVIVIDCGAYEQTAAMGDILTNKAQHRGVAGFVVDGLVRDITGIRKIGLPVFARGITPVGPLHRGPGEINFPIQCGKIVVNPGDVIVGDENGVVVVPQDFAVTLLERLTKISFAESSYLMEVMKGNFSNAWVDRLLKESECEQVE